MCAQPVGDSPPRGGFVHLHVHSYYSFFDSTLSPRDIVALAVEAGAPAVALTDTNALSGVVEFAKAAAVAGIKPLFGAEVRQPLASDRAMLRERNAVAGSARGAWEDGITEPGQSPPAAAGAARSQSPSLCPGDEATRAVLLARDFSGYSEISRVVTRRMLDAGFDLIAEAHGLGPAVVALSDSPDVLRALAARDRPPSPLPAGYGLIVASRRRRRRNRAVYEASRRLGLPLVVACDVKVGCPEDAALHDLLQAMRRLTTVDRVAEDERLDPAQHFQAEERVRAFLGLGGGAHGAADRDTAALRGELAEALANTARIADACECRLPLGEWKFPRFEGLRESPERMLRELVERGLRERYGHPPPPAATERMEHELAVIRRLGFVDYFLLVNRIVEEARARGFHTIGRGSAANSIVSYVLRITNVCPLRYNLYFERFLNPERTAPPDIDIDFSWKDRDEVLQWCFDFFGHDRVALIATIQTLQVRQAIREVAKAHGIPEEEANRFTRLQEIGFRPDDSDEPAPAGTLTGGEVTIGKGVKRDEAEAAFESKSERQAANAAEHGFLPRRFSEVGQSMTKSVSVAPPPGGGSLAAGEPWRTIVAQAARLTDFPRHLSIHCGGIVICPAAVTDFVPLTRSAKGFVITQMDMYGVEDLGLVKIDLLSNRSLGVLGDAIRMIEERTWETEGMEDEANAVPAQEAGARRMEGGAADSGEDDGRRARVFQVEAVRMKAPGTRRGTSVAMAGVLGLFGNAGGAGQVAEDDGGAAYGGRTPCHSLIRSRVMDFEYVTNDPATRAMIDAGETMGCFYIESPGMRALFERLRCRNFEEVVAASSIIRPGVAESGMMQEYITRHQKRLGRSEAPAAKGNAPPHPLLLEVLPETYGVMVYQEDVLRVAHEIAGMPFSEADLLRRAMSGKMRSRDAMEAIQEKFTAGARARGLAGEDIAELWRQMSSFAGYSFCKGHSAAFAVLSYQVSYLKAHYPAEFFAAVLSNGGGFYGAGAYIEEARRFGVEVLGPCVNRSEADYAGQTTARRAKGPGKTGWLRVGLSALRGVGTATVECLLRERREKGDYASVPDFIRRTAIGLEECRVLAKVGALDALGTTAGQLTRGPKDRPVVAVSLGPRGETVKVARRSAGLERRTRRLAGGWAAGQGASPHPAGARRAAILFEVEWLISRRALAGGGDLVPDGDTPPPAAANGLDLSMRDVCRFEAGTLGYMLSAHPLDFVRIPPDVVTATNVRNHAGRRVRMAGWLISAKLLSTKTRHQPMKMLTLEDRTGTFEATLFPRAYARYAPRTLGPGPYMVTGKVDMTLGSPTLNVEGLEVLQQ